MGINEDIQAITDSYYDLKTPTLKDTKLNALVQAKNNKLTNLSNKLGYDVQLSPQQNLSNAVDSQVYYDKAEPYQIDYMLDENGISQGTREVPYRDFNKYGKLDTRDMYIDDTAQGNMKLGLARTDQGGYEGRYDPNMHPTWGKLSDGQLAGPEGVTTEDGALLNITMPYNQATQFEHGVHTNPEQIRNRAMGLGPKTEETNTRFGAGQTEYTTQNAPMWDDNYTSNNEDISNAAPVGDPKYHQVFTESRQPQGMTEAEAMALVYGGDNASSYGENLIDGVQGALGTSAAKVGDMGIDFVLRAGKEIAESISGISEDQANLRIKNIAKKYGLGNIVNNKGNFIALDKYKDMKEYGYDDSRIQSYSKEFKRIVGDENASTLDKVWIAVQGIQHFSEVLATSAGEMALAALPGGMAILAASTTNDFLEERVKTKGTSDLSTEDYAIAGSMGLVYAAVNQFTKGMAGLKPTGTLAKKTVEGLSAIGAKEVVVKLNGMLVNGAFKGAEEGVEEIIQGMAEVVGTKYKTSKEDEILTKDTAIDLALQGTLGMGAGVGSSVAGDTVTSLTNADARKNLQDKITKVAKKEKPLSEAQVKVSNDLDMMDELTKRKSDLPSLTKILDKLSTYNLDTEEAKTKANIIRKKVADKLSAEDIAKISDLNLGSEQEAEYFIEEMYQNATDRESKVLLKNMAKIGKEFGIPMETVRTIKDRAAVEVEATTSGKGYKTYDKDLIRLKKDPEANSKAIERTENTILNFQATQEDRLDRVQKAVDEIQANLKSGTESRTKVNVPYAGGGQYTIHIKDGKINPATIGGINTKGDKVDGVLADIKRTIDGIQKVVARHGIQSSVETNPYEVKGKFRVPDKMPYRQKGKGGTFEFVRNLKKEIVNGNTIVTPIFSKRSNKHISTVNKLKKEGYVEVDKDGYFKDKTGIWVPKAMGTVNEEAEKAKLQKKEQTETKKEVSRLGKKVAEGAKLEPKEQKFVDEHKAEVKQESSQFNVIKEIETIDTKLAARKEKLGLLEEDSNEWSEVSAEIDELQANRDEMLSGAEIKVILKNSSSTEATEPKSKIGKVKFIQPININEYVQEKPSTSLLGSVYVKYFENKIVKEAIESAKLLKKILAAVDYKDDPKMTKAKLQREMLQIISSPARGLVFNTKGEVNENVAVAMEAALTEYIAMGSVNLGAKTEADVARLLGLMPNQKPDSKQMSAFRNAGNYTKNVADDIGKAVLSSLGLKRNENIPQELYGKLVADLGNMAIELGKEQGVLNTHSMDLKTHNELTGKGTSDDIGIGTTVPFVRFTPMGKDMVDKYKLDHDRFKEALHLEDNFVKGPHSTARKTADKKIRNNPITEQPDDGQAVLKVLREEKYVKQDAVVNYITDPENRDVIKYHMGWKSEAEMKKMSFYSRESQEAKNTEIERSIEFLETTELDEMYFEWFYSKNGRYMMDSNTLNPQTDKLHRFAIVPDNHKVDLDLSIDEHNKLFLTALAQALNLSTDKKSTKEVLAYGQNMLERGSEALMEDLKKMDGKAEHISHYLQGVEAIRQYEKHGDKFTTHLSMESDAVTSGFGLKLLQLPILADKDGEMSVIEKTIEWLRKTGIFVGETVESMNDMVSMDDFLDSYETLAGEVKPDEVKEENYPEQGEGAKKWKPWTAVVKYDNHISHKAFTAVLPTVDENGDVSKELRTLFKDPFMTFNYSRGISSIKNGLGYIIADGLIDKFVSGNMSKAEALLLADLKAVYGTNLVKDLQTKEPTSIKANNNSMPDMYTYLAKMGTNTYGHLAAKSLNENFKAFNEANEVINEAFNDMFLQYNEKYLIERDKIETEKGRGITKAEDDALIVSLRDTFPLIKGPYSAENYSDSIAIYDSENVSSKNLEATYGTVSTKLADGKDKKVQSKIRQLKASLKGGSVIPIHYIDAAIIGNTIKANPGTLGIHDAIIPNLLATKKVVQDYNRDVIEVNRDYSVVGAILESYRRVIGENGTDEQKATLTSLQELYDTAQDNRNEVFGSQIDVVHMSAVPGSKYTHNPVKSEQAKTEYNDAQKKALKKYFMKSAWGNMRKEIDLKDC